MSMINKVVELLPSLTIYLLSIICFPLLGSESNFEPGSDYKVFSLATNDCFE